MNLTPRINGIFLAVAALCVAGATQGDPAGPPRSPTAADDAFFVHQVLPVLSRNCFGCHGPKLNKVKGGLRMSDLASLLKGGDRGPALVPGDVAQSLLVQAIRWNDADLEMPPKGPLGYPARMALEQWIATGAHWPQHAPLADAPAPDPVPDDADALSSADPDLAALPAEPKPAPKRSAPTANAPAKPAGAKSAPGKSAPGKSAPGKSAAGKPGTTAAKPAAGKSAPGKSAPATAAPADSAPAHETPAPDAAPPASAPLTSAPADDHDAALFFEQEVRPLLAANCFKCHGPDVKRAKSGLRMSGREALLAGGDRGPAIVPGDVDGSLLIQAVRYADQDLAMPPDGPLKDASVKLLERWVAMGAPWPASESPVAAATAGGAPAAAGAPAAEPEVEAPPPARTIDFDAGRTWWSFRPVQRPEVPAVQDQGFVANPIDAFVAARLEAAGLHPDGRASRAELVRRAWFDLVGLPPTVDEVQRFVQDDAPDAWPRLVDELLAMPQYGERWGRHWLDVVRFAQTNGYERDDEKPQAWRYRDYVIRAFNEDKPYDQFVREQIAGDELDTVTDDGVVATGLYRLGVWDDEPDDAEQAVFDDLDDVVRTIGEGFMGLTIGCARCHDHKFDPFGQEDYYSTLAFVRNVRRYAVPEYATDSAELVPLARSAEGFAGWEDDRTHAIRELAQEKRRLEHEGRALAVTPLLDCVSADASAAWRTPPALRTVQQDLLVATTREFHPPIVNVVKALPLAESRRLFELLQTVETTRTSFEGRLDWGLTVKEAGPAAPPTHVLVRGKADSPAAEVPPRFIRVLCPNDEAALPAITALPRTSGRRRALADWIASPEHPLTARVLVNRLWQHHFGRGLVATPNDFGKTGSPPDDPELLDWLASELVQQGWSIKALQRTIMLSSTYQMSSRVEDGPALAADPDDLLLWRQRLRRLDAEAVRDSVLSAAGTLDLTPGGRGFFPRLSREALAGGSKPGGGWDISTPPEQQRRSVYAFVKRSLLVPLLETFDYTSTSLPVAERSTTTIASQALMLLNSEFMNEQARAFAQRVAREAGHDPQQQVRVAFRAALSRDPTAEELSLATGELARQTEAFAGVQPTLTFRARLPSRMDEEFLRKLQGSDMFYGPEQGWHYLRGTWSAPYQKTRLVDAQAGPAALADGPPFVDGRIDARLLLHAGCEFGSLCLRAGASGDALTGLELRLQTDTGGGPGSVTLLLHGQSVTTLAQTAAPLAPDAWHTVAITAHGGHVQAWLDAAPDAPALIDVSDPRIPARGALGVKTWGETLELDGFTARADGSTDAATFPPQDGGPPDQRALESLCLTILNLDEFVYVD